MIVYMLTRRGSSEAIYVGATKDPVSRISDHRCRFGKDVFLKTLEVVDERRSATRENYWMERKRKEGCKLLNIHPALAPKRF